MTRAENLNAPSLNGAIIASGLGLIALAVSRVVGGFDWTTSAFFGALVFVAAGAFLIIPWGAKDRIPAPAETGGHDAAPAPAAKPAVAPVAAAMAAPAQAPAAAPVASGTGGIAVLEPATATAAGAGTRPEALSAPRGGKADDLKQLEGVGPALEKLLNEMGVFHIDQIARWGAAEVAWMDANLKGFKGRVTRDRWVAQAELIGEVGMEEFLRRAKTNDY